MRAAIARSELVSLGIATFWVLIGSVMLRGAALIVTMIIAVSFGGDELGKYALIRGGVFTISSLLVYAFTVAAIKKISESTDILEKKIWACTLTHMCMFSFLLMSFVILIAFYAIKIELFISKENTYIFICIGLFIFSGLSSIVQAIMVGYKEHKAIGKINSIAALISVPIVVVLSIYYGVIGALIGCLLSYLIEVIFKLNHLVVKNKADFSFVFFDSNKTKEVFKLSLPLFLIALITGPSFYLYKVTLLSFENGLFENGVLEAFYQWLTVIMMITGTLSNVSLSFLSGENKIEPIKIIGLNLFFSMFLFSAFNFFSTEIVAMYGFDFIEYEDVFILMMFNAVLNSVVWVFEKIFSANNFFWNSFVMFLLSVSLGLALYFQLFKSYGLSGVVYSQSFGWSIGVIYGVVSLLWLGIIKIKPLNSTSR